MTMKYLLSFLILLPLFSCKNPNSSNPDEVQKQATVNEKSVEKEAILSNGEQATVPDWLEIVKNAKNKEMNPYGNHYEIESYTVLNDSLSYAVFMSSSGTCLRQELETYWDRKIRDQIEIEESCDHDLSIPTHSWKTFVFVRPTTIQVNKFTESVPDSLITKEGYLKEGVDFIEAETQIDSVITTYTITKKGEIIQN